jgi:PilZ domain-containing protein
MATTAPVQVERRVGQRFPFLLPVSFRVTTTGVEGLGFTQDLSSRGVFFLTGAALHEGDEIELTLTMPAEITLGENMRVRCRGRILRVVKTPDRELPKVSQDVLTQIPSSASAPPPATETKIAVAVRLEHYEYLPDSSAVLAPPRIAVLHTRPEEDAASFIPPQR